MREFLFQSCFVGFYVSFSSDQNHQTERTERKQREIRDKSHIESLHNKNLDKMKKQRNRKLNPLQMKM